MEDRFADVWVLPDGTVQIMTDGALTYEEGVRVTRAIERAIGQAIPGFRIVGAVERHKPDGPSHVHLMPQERVG